MPALSAITLQSGREKSLLRRHPWVFSGAIARIDGDPAPGQTIEILSNGGAWLARGAWSPQSQIAARAWTFDQSETVDADFFRARIARALALRRRLAAREDLTAMRLVNAEADGLPGLIADQYGGYVVAQFLTAGAEAWKETLTPLLAELTGCAGVYERSDADVRRKEGLEPACGLLCGAEPPALIEIREGACRYGVDVRAGHKTGFYLDQRDNRATLAACAAGARVLNCFAYTGGFGIAALAGGAAYVTQLESSAAALALARRNLELNGLDPARAEHVEGDVFQLLRDYRNRDLKFDIIVLDPPKFADSRAQLERACRGYKDINLLAFKLLRPGGLLFTFSCSGLVEADLFQKIVAGAALDAGRDARIVRRLTQGTDHPTALAIPEGSYLKGLVCAVD